MSNVEDKNNIKYAASSQYSYRIAIPAGKFSEKFPKAWLKNLLKLNLPCPCCGNQMIPNSEIESLPGTGVFSGSCLKAIETLKNYENIMKPVELSIFQILKPLAEKYPGIDLQELMILLSFEYESNLVAAQLTLLNKINLFASQLSNDNRKELTEITKTAKEFIIKQRPVKFKRKTFLGDIEEFTAKINDEHIRSQIMDIAHKMPTSEDSASAFIMKYKDRSPEEIGKRLIIFSSASLEHITLHSKLGEVTIWECQECNNKRGNSSIVNQIEENPVMIDHLREHIKIIVEHGNFLKNHGGGSQSQQHYEYAQIIRDEYLKNIKDDKDKAIRIEQEALSKLQFKEIPIPEIYK